MLLVVSFKVITTITGSTSLQVFFPVAFALGSTNSCFLTNCTDEIPLEQIIIKNVPAQPRNASEENSGGALNVEAHLDLGLLVTKLELGYVCGQGGHRAGDKPHPKSFLVPPAEISRLY